MMPFGSEFQKNEIDMCLFCCSLVFVFTFFEILYGFRHLFEQLFEFALLRPVDCIGRVVDVSIGCVIGRLLLLNF